MKTRARNLSATLAIALAIGACGDRGSDDRQDALLPDTDEAAHSHDSAAYVDVAYTRLDNGLRVVLAPERHGPPTVTIGVYYGIGFRLEPRNRTGFAHLFEHLMFQGSRHAPKGEQVRAITGAGGVLNGSTRFDFTNYYQTVPRNALESVLWLEADRMAFPDITQDKLDNQKAVVANEVRVSILNQPYGGFPWLDVPQYANENWHNAHNFYGDLADLEAATLSDATAFFDEFYQPSNAVLVIAGDFDSVAALDSVRQYFGPIETRQPIERPDVSEPVQTAEKRAARYDSLAPSPALALAYHMPERGSRDYYAMALLTEILIKGDDSRLYRRLVREDGFTSGLSGGANLLGNLFTYDGPMLWTVALVHGDEFAPDDIIASVDDIVAALQTELVSDDELKRAKTKFLSGYYDAFDSPTRFSLVDILASFALFDDDPAKINQIREMIDKVTAEDLQNAAQGYLRRSNRTVLEVRPGAPPSDGEGAS